MKNDKEQRDEAKGGEPMQKQEQGFGELRHYVPAEILNVSFPAAVRGYERHAVDAHIKRVNRLIAEIKVSSSPRISLASTGGQNGVSASIDIEARAYRHRGLVPGCGRGREAQAERRRWRSTRRRSRSVRPPHTPCFSRVVRANSRQGLRTAHMPQMLFASSARLSSSRRPRSLIPSPSDQFQRISFRSLLLQLHLAHFVAACKKYFYEIVAS